MSRFSHRHTGLPGVYAGECASLSLLPVIRGHVWETCVKTRQATHGCSLIPSSVPTVVSKGEGNFSDTLEGKKTVQLFPV